MFVTFMWSSRWPLAEPSEDAMPVDDHAGAAKRRRERRLRQFLRHERLPVAMVLSEKKHHTSRRSEEGQDKGGGVRDALHGQVPEDSSPASCSHRVPPADGRRGWWARSWGAAEPLLLRGGRRLRWSGTAASDTSTSWRSMPQCCKWLKRWTMSCFLAR